MRGSDVDAALHYLARMLEAGEDPRFIARRLVIPASEDIGLADPTALQTAVAAAQAVALIGMPEARLILAHATVAPRPGAEVERRHHRHRRGRSPTSGPARSARCPPHLRDGHYAGAADSATARATLRPRRARSVLPPQQYPPDDVAGADYYRPTGHGAEREIGGRLDKLRAIIRRRR